MRRSTVFFLAVSLVAGVLALTVLHAAQARQAAMPRLSEQRSLAATLGLSDLCLFTEASYTRHPSLTDPLAPFPDGPHTLEHFPSGSLVAPPPWLAKSDYD